MALAQPVQKVRVLVVSAVLTVGAAIGIGLGPRVLAGTVEGRAGEVEAIALRLAVSIVHDDFGLQASENTQGLRVALETIKRDLIERVFAIVSIGWVADVMGKPCHIAEIRIEAEPSTDAARDLANLQGVGQPGARGIAVARPDDLRFIR